jgi:intracellular septation protein A
MNKDVLVIGLYQAEAGRLTAIHRVVGVVTIYVWAALFSAAMSHWSWITSAFVFVFGILVLDFHDEQIRVNQWKLAMRYKHYRPPGQHKGATVVLNTR